MKRFVLAGAGALAFTAVAGAGGASAVHAPGDNPKASKGSTATVDCINATSGADEGDITYPAGMSAWPPNHKYVDAVVTLTDADDETTTDTATLAVTGRHNQMVDDTTEATGSGNTDPATDVVPGAGTGNPTASATVRFRAERSGHKQNPDGTTGGRVYTFTITGTTDNETSRCEPVTFTATIPHDQGQNGAKPKTSRKRSTKARSAR